MVKISQSALVQQSGNDIYFIIEGPCDGYFTEKVSQARGLKYVPLTAPEIHIKI